MRVGPFGLKSVVRRPRSWKKQVHSDPSASRAGTQRRAVRHGATGEHESLELVEIAAPSGLSAASGAPEVRGLTAGHPRTDATRGCLRARNRLEHQDDETVGDRSTRHRHRALAEQERASGPVDGREGARRDRLARPVEIEEPGGAVGEVPSVRAAQKDTDATARHVGARKTGIRQRRLDGIEQQPAATLLGWAGSPIAASQRNSRRQTDERHAYFRRIVGCELG